MRASLRRPAGVRRVIQLIEGERHLIVDEAEEALIAAGGFDIYQRDAVMVRPVMHRLPAANRHGIKRATVAWRLMRGETALSDRDAGAGRLLSELRPPAPGLDRQGLPERDRRDTAGARGCLAGAGAARRRAHAAASGGRLAPDDARIRPADPAAVSSRTASTFPRSPSTPARKTRARALEAVKQSIATFPFSGEADRSVALSLLLTGVCRRTLDFAPLHAITAPAPGTGKSLLVDLVSILLSGQPAPVISAEIDAAEFEKRLGASLMAGDPVISFDNCTKPLDHALLCQALSQSRLNLRVLGYSQNRDVTMSALLTVTGNNLILQGDLPRRSLRCEIDAKVRAAGAAGISRRQHSDRVSPPAWRAGGGAADDPACVSGFRR